MSEKQRHPPGRRRPPEQQRRQIGENLLVPAAVNRDERTVARGDQHAPGHRVLVFLPDAHVGLQVVRNLMQEHRLPRIVAIPGHADHRERICLAQ
jgi:hypothetical protein